MSDLPTQRELTTAHERRARTIAELHKHAIAKANDLSDQHKMIGTAIVKAARWQKAEAWLFVVGTVSLALGCVFTIGWLLLE